tara:strand:+ start:556 stop:978 length:423 start_codon:yes stop_codon:yes gene_type:complete
MNEDTSSGSGSPNKTTKVNTVNVGYTIVASVRMHSDAGPGYDEDKMIALGVNKKTGELVCWERYWVEERGEQNGWGGGKYQPYRFDSAGRNMNNSALQAFMDRIKDEMHACISRTELVRNEALEAKLMPTIDESMPEEEE